MYKTEVGDHFYLDDPAVNRLQEKAAELLDNEDAPFVSSGTLGNTVSIITQTNSGDEIIMESRAYLLNGEAGYFVLV